jgi:hypothetical protein
MRQVLRVLPLKPLHTFTVQQCNVAASLHYSLISHSDPMRLL